jgi:serine/threonine protein kinase
MPRIDAAWRVLAGPPSLETCSRDVYDPALSLPAETAVRLAVAVGKGAAHLHREGLLHGDLYAHNVIWDGARGEAVLSDFGAASFLGVGDAAFTALDVRAWGILLEELTARCAGPVGSEVHAVTAACLQPDVAGRPSLAAAIDALEAVLV